MSWAAFDVRSWLQAHPPPACEGTQLSQPVRHGKGWTKRGNTIEHGDCSGLPALERPLVGPIDLNMGIEDFVPNTPDSPAGVEIVIEAILRSGAKIQDGDVITFRNNLNKIFGTMFQRNSGWAVDAIALSIQMKNLLLLDIVNKTAADSSKHDINSVYGYQFEAKCCGEAVADASQEYGMVCSTKIFQNTAKALGLRLYIGAEIDAYEDDGINPPRHSGDRKPPPVESLRELKTFRKPAHPGQERTLFGYKYPKWWLQSYLVGVPSLVLGVRNEAGIVEEIMSVKTSELPRISWNHGATWSPTQALAFGLDVLTWMKNVVTNDPLGLGGKRCFRFEYKPELCKICVAEIDGEQLLARVMGVVVGKL